MNKFTKVIIILITLLGLIFTFNPVESEDTLKIAAGPAYITIEKAFRNATYEEPIFIFNQNNFNTTVELEVSGVLSEWVKFYETNNDSNPILSTFITKNTDKPIRCLIKVPNDAANGVYRGFIKYSAKPKVQDNNSINVSKLVLSSTTSLYLNVSGDEIKNISIERVEVNDVEMEQQVRFYFSIVNNGNVLAYPVINISILNKFGILLEQIQKVLKIEPGNIKKQTVEWSTIGIIAENYTANIKISIDDKNYLNNDYVFRIYPIGTLYEWNATLREIKYEGDLEAGKFLKIVAEFRNLGEIETSAKFIGEVYLNGKFVDTIESEEYNVKKFTTESIEAYVKLIDDGNYRIKGYVLYSGIRTQEKTLKFNIESTSIINSLYILFIVFIIILIIIYLFLFSKKKKVSFVKFKRPIITKKLRIRRKASKPRIVKTKTKGVKHRIKVRRKIRFRRIVPKSKKEKPIKLKDTPKQKNKKVKAKPSKEKKSKKVKKMKKEKPLRIEDMTAEEIENYVKSL